MTILYLNSVKNIHSRDTVYLNGLRELGVEIIECRDWSPGLRKFFAIYRKHRELNKKYDLIVIGYSGHLLVPLARLISRKPIIFNTLASLYEGMAISRGRYGFLGLKAVWYWLVDFIGFRCANLVLVETNAQKRYLQKLFFLPEKKFLRAWSGADEKKLFFDSDISKRDNFTVLFRGAFLPESGIQYVAEAAKILQDKGVNFRIIGNGMMAKKFQDILDSFDSKNVEWIKDPLSGEELRSKMQECHLSLGQLSDHPRLKRTTPFKVFESMAMKLPYLTARNEGIMELVTENDTCLACNPADPKDLAEKILWAKNDPEETKKIAENAYRFFRENLNSKALAQVMLTRAGKLLPSAPSKKYFKKKIKNWLKVIGYDIDRKRLLKRYQDLIPYNFTTILDIGANVGQFSQEMLSIFPNAQIYAFEPIKSCYEKLATVSQKSNFHALQYALGNKNGETEINVSSYDPSSSILKMSDLHKKLFPHTAGEHKEKILIRRLDDMSKEIDIKTPLLIKMDVQGYEKEVILGGMDKFKKASAVISEASFVPLYEGQPLADEIRGLLEELGFKYHGFLNQKKNPQTGEVLFEDSLFIRD